jgi:hypothetical protein
MITTRKIDELGALLSQIKTLTEKAEAIKKDIKEEASLSGQKLWAGEVFDAVYSESNVSTVDWKALAKELAIPADLIAKHTKTAARYTVKVEEK